MEIRDELMNTIGLGGKLCITFKNGKEICGILCEYGEEYFSVELEDSKKKSVSYSLVGFFEEVGASESPAKTDENIHNSYREVEESDTSLNTLTTALKDKNPEVHKLCSARIEQFRYAVKVKETGEKFGRTQPVINTLITLADKYGNCRQELQKLLGAVIVEAHDEIFAQNYISYWSGLLDSSAPVDEQTGKLLAQLSYLSGTHYNIIEYFKKHGKASLVLFGAVMLILKLSGKQAVLPRNDDALNPANIEYLTEQLNILTNTLPASAVLDKPVTILSAITPKKTFETLPELKAILPDAQDNNYLPVQAGEHFGKISFYDFSAKHGSIRCENSDFFPFLMRNVTDIGLVNLLESSPAGYTKASVAFKISSFIDKLGNKRPNAVSIRCAQAPIKTEVKEIRLDDSDKLLKQANKSFSMGKAGDVETLKLYLRAFSEGNRAEQIAPNIVSIYMRSGQTQQAVDFLLKHMDVFGGEQYNNWLYQAYMQMEDTEKALVVQERIITQTQRPANKLHHLTLRLTYYYNAFRYSEALKSCEAWLDCRKKNAGDLSNETISLVLREKRVCFTAAQCIVHLREEIPGFKPTSAIMSYLKNDSSAQEILASGSSTTIDSANFGDFRDYISPIVRKLLDDCVLSEWGVHSRLIRPEDGRYTGSLSDAKALSTSLTKTSTTQKPYSRFRSFIGAARIIFDSLDMANRNDIVKDPDLEASLENTLFSCIGKALVALGDDTVGRHDVPIDVARFYYLESIQYAGIGDQDKINAITRYILSVFVDRLKLPMKMLTDDNLSIQRDLLKRLDESPDINAQPLVYAIVRIISSSLPGHAKRFKEQLSAGVMQSRKSKFVEAETVSLLDGSERQNARTTSFDGGLESLIGILRQAKVDFDIIIRRLQGISFAPLWLRETQEAIVRNGGFIPFMDELDQKRMDIMSGLINKSVEYNQFESFSLKESSLSLILSQLEVLEQSIHKYPTKYAFEYFKDVVIRWKEIATDTLRDLYCNKLPVISCQIVAHEELHVVDNDCVYIQFFIANDNDRQKADSLTVHMRDSDEYSVLTPLEGTFVIDEGDVKTIKVKLRLVNPNSKALKLNVNVEYEYNVSATIKGKENKPFELTVELGNHEFKELDNPYNAYVSGGAVDREEMVFGRAEFIDGIVLTIKGDGIQPLRRKTIALYGQKRTGKSTVLYHLDLKLRAEAKSTIVINIGDINSLPSNHFERALNSKIFTNLEKELSRNHGELYEEIKHAGLLIPSREDIMKSETGRELFCEFFEDLNRFLIEKNYNVVLLLDEFTTLYIRLCRGLLDDEFMKYWKAIINNYGLVGVVVGQDYMMDFVDAYPNPFAAIDKRQISYLHEDQARIMIKEPPAIDRAVFDGLSGDRAVKKIISLTAGSAYFIMILMDRLIKYLNYANQTYVTDADIDTLVSDDLLSGINRLDLTHFESLYYDDSDITDRARPRDNVALLWIISKRLHDLSRCRKEDILDSRDIISSVLPKDRVDSLLDRLIKRSVIGVEKGNYQINIGLFDEWLNSNCSADTVNSIQNFK